MATTDLSSKSLGDISLESGIGAPDHTSPKGSLYVDKDSNTLYINTTGTTWQNQTMSSYGEGYYINNTTETTISVASTWTSVGNAFVTGQTLNFTVSSDTLILDAGCDGLYDINGSVTLDWVATTPNIEVGISANGANPVDGCYNGATISATYTTANIAFSCQANLTGGTTLELAVQNLTDTSNVIILHAQLTAHRVK